MAARKKHTKRRNLIHNARIRKKNEPKHRPGGTGHKPGTVIQLSDGTEYLVKSAGNWKRITA